MLAPGLTPPVSGMILTGCRRRAREGQLNEKDAYRDGEIHIVIRLTADQVDQLPPGVKRAVEQLIVEFRQAGSSVPVSRGLSMIAHEIDEIVGKIADDGTAPIPDLRAALELRADELRIRDEIGDWTPPCPSTCGVIERPPPWAVIGGVITILPRRRRQLDDPREP